MVLEKEKLVGRGIVFEKKDYEYAISKFPNTGLTDYQFACYCCSHEISRFHEKHKRIKPIEIFFEHRDNFHNPYIDTVNELAKFDEFLNKIGIISITRVKNEGVRPLEVADLIAYELSKAHTRMISGHPQEPRYQAIRLNHIMKGKSRKLSLDILEKLLSGFNRT